MSKKTIEVISRSAGKINMTLPDGERVSVDFKEKTGPEGRPVGYAMVEEKVANHLLGEIGPPAFRRVGEDFDQVEAAVQTELNEKKVEAPTEGGEGDESKADGSEDNEKPTDDAATTITEEEFAEIPNAGQLEARIATVTDKAALMRLVVSESQAEKTRSSWVTALNKRIDDIDAAAGNE